MRGPGTIESAAELSLVADERQLRSIRARCIADLFNRKGWISTKPLAELRQVFEINGPTDQQDLVCLALSALLPPRRGSARLISKIMWES
jgi:hypothetical protein